MLVKMWIQIDDSDAEKPKYDEALFSPIRVDILPRIGEKLWISAEEENATYFLKIVEICHIMRAGKKYNSGSSIEVFTTHFAPKIVSEYRGI